MYLNNNDKGETTFPDYDVSVKPETGKVLVFPPLWTYKHTGEKPTIKPKIYYRKLSTLCLINLKKHYYLI